MASKWESKIRGLEYPPGTRFKDREELERLLAEGLDELHEHKYDVLVEAVNLAMKAGGRKVPSYVWKKF